MNVGGELDRRAEEGEWHFGEAVPGDDVLVEWAGSCAGDTHDYQKLYVHVTEGTLPVAPIQLDWADTGSFTAAFPAELAPWLPAYMVALADPVSLLPDTDGAQVTVAVVQFDMAATWSPDMAGDGFWAVGEYRWPAAASLAVIPIAENVPLPTHGVPLNVDLSRALPPQPWSLGPQALDALFAGAFLNDLAFSAVNR